jgi:hypothetical protein
MRSRIIAAVAAAGLLFGGSALLPASASQAPAPRTSAAATPLPADSVTGPVQIKDGTVYGADLAPGMVAWFTGGPYNGTVHNATLDAPLQAKVNQLGTAYYSVAYYDVGDTNAGAIATVACKNVTDTAISGGVSVVDFTKNTPVSSSFPGRMDWSTNTSLADRLDGWIVQFGGNAGTVSDKDPLKVKIYALCVPGLDIPSIQMYTQSADN